MLLSCFSRALLCRSPQRGPSSATQAPSANAAQSADNQELIIYETILEKPLSTKKSAAGEIVRVRTNAIEGRPGLTISEFIGHIIEVHPRGKNDKQSYISLRFDSAIITGLERPLFASIRAVASVDNAGYGFSPVIVDQYPCREDEKCSKSKEDQIEKLPPILRGGAYRIFCSQKVSVRPKNQKPVCSDLPHAEGVFGIDGLSFQPLAQDPAQGSLLTSSEKNIRIETGSYVILAVKNSFSDSASDRK